MMDSHLHTECSFDCVPGCSDGLGEWAMALGLSGFTVTDHLEIGVGQPGRFRQNLLDSLDYVRGLQKRFPMLDIGFGAELGQPHHDLREAAEAVSGLPLDFILASCHLVRGQPDFCDMAPGSYDPDALLEQYFREVLELVRSVDFDSLAHLTYPLRYFEGQHGVQVDLSRFSGLIDAILSEVIMPGTQPGGQFLGVASGHGRPAARPGTAGAVPEAGRLEDHDRIGCPPYRRSGSGLCPDQEAIAGAGICRGVSLPGPGAYLPSLFRRNPAPGHLSRGQFGIDCK